MITYLLDVNVLIALIDPVHLHHETAHAWFKSKGQRAWATCPLTQNGVVRIVSNPRYPNCVGTPAVAAEVMARLCKMTDHVFWADDISLLNDKLFDNGRLLDSSQITDSYLLALARFHGGALATFDSRLVVDAVRGGRTALHLIV